MKSLVFLAISRLLPGLISFISIGIYIRLIGTEEYGIYAIYVSTAGILYNFMFNWTKNTYSKMYLEQSDNKLGVISILFYTQTILVLITIPIGLITADFLEINAPLLIFYTYALVILGNTLEHLKNKRLSQKYMLVSISRAIIFFLGSIILISFIKESHSSILLSFIITVTILGFWNLNFKKIYDIFQLYSRDKLKEFLRIGLPLILVYGSSYILANSDRIFISKILDFSEAGKYAAIYDLISFPILTLLMIAYLYFSPMILAESKNENTFNVKYLNFIIFFLSPVFVGLNIFGKSIIEFMTGTNLDASDSSLILLISLSIIFLCLKSYFIDLVFLKYNLTKFQIIPVIISVIINLILNATLISELGIKGAAIATLVSYLLQLLIAVVILQRKYPLRLFNKTTFMLSIPLITMLLFNIIFLSENLTLKILVFMISLLLYLVLIFIGFKFNLNKALKQFGLNINSD